MAEALGEFLLAFRRLQESHRAGNSVEEAERGLEQAFDQLTTLSMQLEQIHVRNLESFRALEDERRRIARDIHDGPAQRLAWLVRQMEYASHLLKEDRRTELDAALLEMKSDLQAGVADLRGLIFDLRPPEIDQFGLAEALRQHLKRSADRHGVRWEAELSDPRGLEPRDEVLVFRILQEAISNAVKHGAASELRLRLAVAEPGRIEITLDDDGSPFEPPSDWKTLSTQGRFGLISMHERAEMTGGTLFFEKSPLGGSRFRLLIIKELV